MAKSSSIYMGEAKMALSGKWKNALAASCTLFAISSAPSLLGIILPEALSSLISLIWAICVVAPLSFACVVALRQQHIANETPLTVMIDNFKQNAKRYLFLGLKVFLKILKILAIPAILFLICIVKSIIDFGNWSATTQYSDMAGLCMTAIVGIVVYKSLEYVFLPFVWNDNPEMSDNEIINKSSALTKDNKWTIVKIFIRALLPIILISFVLYIPIFIACAIFIGALAGGGFHSFWDMFSFSDNIYGHSMFNVVFVTIFIFSCFGILLSAYTQIRTIVPLSVLYSELSGYDNSAALTISSNDNTSSDNNKREEVLVLDSSEPSNDEEKEEKKVEPEIPYEQRYMPQSPTSTEPEDSTKSDDKKDDSDLPYEQRYMPRN